MTVSPYTDIIKCTLHQNCSDIKMMHTASLCLHGFVLLAGIMNILAEKCFFTKDTNEISDDKDWGELAGTIIR